MPDHTKAALAMPRRRQREFSSAGGDARFASRICLLAVALLVVSGCAPLKNWVRNGFKVGPNYGRPAASVADDWIDTDDQRVRTELPDNPMWWEAFDDPTLNELVQSVYEQNLTLRAAGMRVLQARAMRGVAVGGLFPQTQEAFGSYQRNQISASTSGLGQLIGKGFPIARVFDNWSTGIDAYWEFDIWGKFRRNIEAADADLDASIEDYDAILVSLLGETAATYVELRTAQQQLAFAESNVEIQIGSLRIAQARFEGGAENELDYRQALSNLKNTEQLVPQFEARVRDANLRLCTLLGIPPRDLTAEIGRGGIPSAAPDVAVGIPADLLRRRPDIRAAERRVAAQSARIGVATADLFPHFSITGSMRVDSERFKDLFSQASTAGIVSPAFNWDLLHYGRLVNNIRLQDARFQQVAMEYQQSVLLANAEVETGINNFLKAQQRLKAAEEAVAASERAVELARVRFDAGKDSFNRVFVTQIFLVQDQDRLAQSRGNVALSLIAIYKAMGGGWEIRNGYSPAVVSAEMLPTPADAVPPTDIPPTR